MDLSSELVARFRTTVVGELVAVGSSALLIVLLARVLTPDEYGLLFLTISIFGVLHLFTNLGIARSAARYISYYKEIDTTQLSHIIRISLTYNLIAIVIVSVVTVIIHQQLANLVNEPRLEPYLLLGILYLIFGSLATYVRYVLQGFEAIQSAALTQIVNYGSRLFFAVGFVAVGYGAFGAFGGYILGVMITTVVGFLLLYTQLSEIGVTSAVTSVDDGLRRRIAEYAIPLTATHTANVLDKDIDTVLVGYFLTPIAVSYYVVGKQVITFIETPVAALGFTLSPTFGADKALGKIDRAARVYETALVHSLLLYIPAAAGLVLVAEPVVELVFGSEYLGAVPVLQIFALYAILQSITQMTTSGLDFLGRARSRAIGKGVTSVMNVGLNLILIPAIGVIGATIATVVTYSIYTFLNVYIIHTEFKLRLGYLFRKTVLISAVTLGMAAVVSIFLNYIRGWITLLIVVGIGVAVWAFLSIVTGLLDIRDIASALS